MSRPFVAIVMGSDSDLPVMEASFDVLRAFGVSFEARITSAHRTPEATKAYVQDAEQRGFQERSQQQRAPPAVFLGARAGPAAAKEEVEAVPVVVEQPRVLATRQPCGQPAAQAAATREAEVARNFDQIALGRLMAIVAFDGSLNDLPLFGIKRVAACDEAVFQPLGEEGAIGRRIGQRQRVEATGFADGDVGNGRATGACKDFAAVLVVEIENTWIDLLRLGQ